MPRAGIEPTTHRFHNWCSTTELSRQLQWDGLILNTDFQAFAPRPQTGNYFSLLIIKQLAYHEMCHITTENIVNFSDYRI